jgi:uncharacterized protein YbaP (TraB family)
MRAVLLLCVLAGCQKEGTAVAKQGSAADPWAVAPAADDPPSLTERHKLADETCPSVKAPYFFRVEKDGHTNYLLGTYHIGVPFSKFPAIVHDTLDQSKLVMFELPPDTHMKLPREAKISIPDTLGPDLWKHYRELVGSTFADGHTHESPMMASIELALMYDDPTVFLEHQIQDELRPLSIPMDGLETQDFQHDVLVKLFDARLLRAIVSTTKDRAQLRDEKVRGLRKYCEGTGAADDLFDDHERKAMHDVGYSDADLDGFETTLVYARNAAWIPKLESLFAKDGVFIAVGAGHLLGPKGVPALLQAEGYVVTRVTPPR